MTAGHFIHHESADMSDSTGKIPYYKPNEMWWTWEKQEGAKACYKVEVEEIFLATDMRPPPLRDQSPPAPVVAEPKKYTIETVGLLGMAFVKMNDLVDWMQEPPPPPPPVPDAKTLPRPKFPHVKPFDIQEIPAAMDKLGWKFAARLMRKWFSGELNYVTDDESDKKHINQLGQPFPQSMIDTNMIKMDWILSFPRARRKFEDLLSLAFIQSDHAHKELRKILERCLAADCKYRVDGWEAAGRDIQQLHQQFQFQNIGVDTSMWDKAVLLGRTNTSAVGVPDDLAGALGSFGLYAALGHAKFEWVTTKRVKVTVTHIIVYMKDAYSFYDRSSITGSQYLGHWNRGGVLLVPAKPDDPLAKVNDWFKYPVATNWPWKNSNVYYPIQNKDFREWQQKHRQGGDILLFSDPKTVQLKPWITMEIFL
jgi:hypothetical protein